MKTFFLSDDGAGHLTALPGQELKRGVRLIEGVHVTGCRAAFRKHPPGTVFCSTTLRWRGAIYVTDDLVAVADGAGRCLVEDIFLMPLYAAYQKGFPSGHTSARPQDENVPAGGKTASTATV